MNIDKIKEIIALNLPDAITRAQIIDCIASDENVIPTVMDILNAEREFKKQIMNEMNSLLSLSESSLETPKLNIEGFVQRDIMKFFKKYADVKGIFHCFKQP